MLGGSTGSDASDDEAQLTMYQLATRVLPNQPPRGMLRSA
jgi:hypothetical protein